MKWNLIAVCICNLILGTHYYLVEIWEDYYYYICHQLFVWFQVVSVCMKLYIMGSVWWFGKVMWNEIMDAFLGYDNRNWQWDLKFGHFLGFGFLNMWLEREGEWHLFGWCLCVSPCSLFSFPLLKLR